MKNVPRMSISKSFVTDEILQDIAVHTNIYNMQKNCTNLNLNRRKELEKFLSIYFRMGPVQLPSQRSYWETFMSYDGVSSVLSRNRFEAIIRNVHFVDNVSISEENKKQDRLWKLRPRISELRGNFLKVTPEEYNPVNEIMVPFKGK